MTSETPAAHLARLKVAYPVWTLWKGEATGEYWAQPPKGHPHRELIHAADVPALEAAIGEAESRRES
ncbi:MAG TPA: hypothetical protein VGM53_19685 [Streptosporangiaceae bacterium]|jgi:hypothetical protein